MRLSRTPDGSSIAIPTLALACWLFCGIAQATTYHLLYPTSGGQGFGVLPGTYSFQIDLIPPYRETRWYLNGVLKETDNSGFFAVAPQFTRALPQGYYTIQGKVYSGGVYDRTLTWTIHAELADVKITTIYTEPAYPLSGQAFKIVSGVSNVGGVDASAGLLRDQEAFFYFDNNFVGEDNYDDLAGTVFVQSSVYLRSPEISSTTPGTHTIRAFADANNEVEESNENNNQLVGVITVRGSDWIQVPVVVGRPQADAELVLDGAGFSITNVDFQFSETVPEGNVISQIPNANGWVPPGETDVSLVVSVGPACAVRVTDPSDGDQWRVGGRKKIRWITDGTCCDDVRIELWKNGQKVRTIKKSTPNDGRFNWRIKVEQYAPAHGYRIRVVCDKYRNDLSKGTFSLTAPK